MNSLVSCAGGAAPKERLAHTNWANALWFWLQTGCTGRHLPQTEIGRTAYYRAVQNGGEWDDAPTIPFAFAANSLKCFAPVKIKGSRDGSNNLTISWIRRTRWYGEWQDGIDVPLFEANERYEIDILSGSTNFNEWSCKRTLSATTPSVIYTAANQTTDFGAPQGAVSIAIYQINAVIGRGFL
jgi:hypothetical protein